MRVCSYDAGSGARAGIVVEEAALVDVASAVGSQADGVDAADLVALIEAGPAGRAILQHAADARGAERIPLDAVRLRAPYRPRQAVMVADGNAETAAGKPKESVPLPGYYGRMPSAILDPEASIHWPRALTDEVYVDPQLAIVIGRTFAYATPETARDAIFGYSIMSAVSALNLRTKHAQLMKAGSLDTFMPWGPWITTSDEVGDPDDLAVELELDGEVVFSTSTADAHLSVVEVLCDLSLGITFRAGDVLLLGSSESVGPDGPIGRFLRPGDVVLSRIATLGELSNPVGDPY